MTHPVTRRTVLIGAAAAAALASPGRAAAPAVRIGYQKYGNLVLLKGRGTLEPVLAAQGVSVTWAEFATGPALIEAINAGAIDFGTTGEAPPIFAQANGVPLVYVAHEPPTPRGEAILVRKDSPLQTVADLKGQKVAFNKGSNVHYLVVKALEKAGLAYGDIQPQFLAPPDARAAFERGEVAAWAIWDPFLASAEAAGTTRQLTDGTGIVSNHQFYLASRSYAEGNGAVIDTVIAALGETNTWVKGDPVAAAAQLSPVIGIPEPILQVALGRQSFGVSPLSPAVVAEQQKIADTFQDLGLLKAPIVVADAVRKAGA